MAGVEEQPDGTFKLTGVEVFRAGDYGDRGVYSEEDLKTLASRYSPTLCEAPLTLDHVDDGPAVGWVERLATSGALLLADFRQVPFWVVDSLRQGAWKKRSVEIYRNVESLGGAPGYLKAVALLGAVTPEVKGLADVFEDKGRAFARYGGGNYPPTKFEEVSPVDPTPAKPAVSVEDFAAAQTKVATLEAQNKELSTKVSEFGTKNTELATQAAAFKAANEALSARLTSLEAEREHDRAVGAFNASFSAMAQEGRVTKAERDSLLADYLDLPGSNKVKFGADKEGSSRDRYLHNLSQRPIVVPVGGVPITTPATPAKMADPADRVSFSAQVDEEAKKLQAADKNLDYLDACAQAERNLLRK
jgi:hypothetical protein